MKNNQKPNAKVGPGSGIACAFNSFSSRLRENKTLPTSVRRMQEVLDPHFTAIKNLSQRWSLGPHLRSSMHINISPAHTFLKGDN